MNDHRTGSGPRVTVVVVTHRAADFLQAALDGLAAQTVPHRLLVIDNASSDGTAAILTHAVQTGAVPAESVHRMASNTGFAGAVAAALPMVTTTFTALLNDDAVPDPNWLEELLSAADGDSTAAAWTSLLVLADRPGVVNNTGAALNEKWYGIDVNAGKSVEEIPARVLDVFGFCGGAALLRTAALRAVGGFPAEFFLYYEDLETSWQLRRAGWSIRTVPTARVVHRHAATTDRRSALFHFYNERNRLLTLARCAPLWVAPVQLLRFVLTTGSLAASRALGRSVPDDANFRLGLRLRVLAAALKMLPGQYRHRRRSVELGRRPAGLGRGQDDRVGQTGEPVGSPAAESGHRPGGLH